MPLTGTTVEEMATEINRLDAMFAEMNAKATMVDTDARLAYWALVEKLEAAVELTQLRLEEYKVAEGEARDEFLTLLHEAFDRAEDLLELTRYRFDEYSTY